MSKRLVTGSAVVAFLVFVAAAIASSAFNKVKPAVFDPAHSHLVQSGWPSGIGCPTPPAALSSLNVKEIDIVFDEGTDTGPDFFGLAVLDNVDVNGMLVGQGAGPRNEDEDADDGD